ncbi:acyl-CoA thioester hydrolase [Pseudonocardia thermophila]|jgi:Predicted thioesterase|uniref:Acyl-CoA thioester hydrolase n=1 Tax=Pseudonocardia thermophila TaxID=1848 RepID=A0A1M6WMR9_PSETH|nr:thioesterase family protein [Pseudonocardia thermophila]SHK94998.1 acyl-CoA thioester hydrolase [Pseudonocardia thermophila]
MSGKRFTTLVPMRWSDLDDYGHLNNARAVTILEEARIAFLWSARAENAGVSFRGGLLVAGLNVEYKRQVTYRAGRSLRVGMGIDEVRAASFRILYDLHDGPEAEDPVAIRAWTRMALYDMDAQRPRRLSEAEREYLSGFVEDAS